MNNTYPMLTSNVIWGYYIQYSNHFQKNCQLYMWPPPHVNNVGYRLIEFKCNILDTSPKKDYVIYRQEFPEILALKPLGYQQYIKPLYNCAK